jgi:hypothetical protein
MNKKIVLLLICIFSTALNSSGSGIEGKGETVFPFLKINPSVNSSGLAGSNAATLEGIQSIYLNPAGIASIKKPSLYAQYTKWIDNMNLGYVSFGKTTSKKTVFGVSAGYMQYPKQKETAAADNDYNYVELGSFSAATGFIGTYLSGKFTDNISGGAGVKFIRQEIGDFKIAQTVAFDIGMIAKANSYTKYGISLNNLSYGVEYGDDIEPLPATLRFGGEWEYVPDEYVYDNRPMADWRYTFYLCGDLKFKDGVNINSGIEVNPNRYIAVRAGYSYALESDQLGGIGGASFGVGLMDLITINGLDIDYAMSSLGKLGLAHRLGLRFTI